MIDSQALNWSLRIPFIAAPALPLEKAEVIKLGDLQAELRPASFGYSMLLIEGIGSKEAALGLFESLKIGLLVASLNAHWGVRVRDEVQILDYETPMPSEHDVPLIYPQGKNLSRIVMGSFVIQTQVSKVLPKLVGSLDFAIKSQSARLALADARLKLAAELYVDSYFEASDSSRFLVLVNVLEVLKDKDDVSDNACALIDKWIEDADAELDPREAASIQGSLRHLKAISISRGIASVVERHLGLDQAKEAQQLYQMRSKLIHNGLRPASFHDIVARTENLVTNLFARILLSGSV